MNKNISNVTNTVDAKRVYVPMVFAKLRMRGNGVDTWQC